MKIHNTKSRLPWVRQKMYLKKIICTLKRKWFFITRRDRLKVSLEGDRLAWEDCEARRAWTFKGCRQMVSKGFRHRVITMNSGALWRPLLSTTHRPTMRLWHLPPFNRHQGSQFLSPPRKTRWGEEDWTEEESRCGISNRENTYVTPRQSTGLYRRTQHMQPFSFGTREYLLEKNE